MPLPPGSRVHLHAAFRCCPYAGAVLSQIQAYLRQNGHIVTDGPDDAEVQLIHTCGSDARKAALTWDTLHALAARPELPVVVTGCLVAIEPTRLAAELEPFAHNVRLDPRHLHQLDAVFAAPNIPFSEVQPLAAAFSGTELAAGWLQVVASTGCLGTCGFCAIRRATGRPRSRAIPAILDDLRRGLAEGHHDVLVVSTDLSAWGTDQQNDVVALVAALTEAADAQLLAAESFEPTLFLRHFDALLPYLTSGRWSWIGLPIQSGSPRILAAMERRYDPAAVLEAVARLQRAAPDLVVRTDLLYGYADETEADFEASVRASRAFGLPSFNAYQPRPGTPPLTLPTEVLLRRRDAAFAELHARAQAGLPPIRRWGAPAELPVEKPAENPADLLVDAGPPAAPADPWDTDAGRDRLLDLTRRFTRALLAGPRPLGDGWTLRAARLLPDAVALELGHRDGRNVEIGLRPAEWPGEAPIRGARFALWVRSGRGDSGLDGVLRQLAG